MDQYRRPFPTPASRRPVHVFPREILRPFLAAIERDLPKLRDRAALLVWPRTPPFETPDRNRWEQLFPSHRTVMFEGAGHYMQEDAPQQIVDAIRSWKQETG